MVNQRELLKCKTRADLQSFARRNNLPMTTRGEEVYIGTWVCIVKNDKFLYIK